MSTYKHDLKRALEAYDKEVMAHRATEKRLLDKVAECRRAGCPVDRTSNENAQLRADLATAKAENEKLKALFQQTHGCHHSWVEQARDTRIELESESTAHASTRAELAEVRKALDTAYQDRNAAQVARAAMHATLASTRTELSAAQERVRELEQENTELQTFRTVFSKDRIRG